MPAALENMGFKKENATMLMVTEKEEYTCLDLSLPGNYKYAKDAPEIYISKVGRMRNVTKKSGFRTRLSNWHLLFFVEDGYAEVSSKGLHHALEKGAVFAILPGMPAKYTIKSDSWTYTWVMFDGRIVGEIFREAGIDDANFMLNTKCSDSIYQLLDDIEMYYRDDSFSKFFPVVTAWKIIEFISLHQSGIKNVVTPKSLAEQAKVMMDQHFADALMVEDITDKLTVSRSTLFRHFKQEFNSSPKQYLDELRLKKVLELLLNSEMTMKEIAYGCGFHDDQHFSRTFKEAFGQSPLQWKKEQQNG